MGKRHNVIITYFSLGFYFCLFCIVEFEVCVLNGSYCCGWLYIDCGLFFLTFYNDLLNLYPFLWCLITHISVVKNNTNTINNFPHKDYFLRCWTIYWSTTKIRYVTSNACFIGHRWSINNSPDICENVILSYRFPS